MGYFQQRAKSMAISFAVGFVVGWFQPMLDGAAAVDSSTRLFLGLQTGAVFTVVTLFALNYLAVRRRVYDKLMNQPSKKVSTKP